MGRINYYVKKYLKNRPAFFAFIRPIEAELFNNNYQFIKSPILDFGCGDGFFAETVFGKGKIDIGLDLSSKKRINEAVIKKTYKKLVFYNGNKIPYPNHYFQTVISNCVLEHIQNIDHSLKEINRILKPKGFFFTSVMTDKWEDYLFGKKIFGSFYQKFMKKKQKHYQLLTVNEWKEKFIQSGFKIEKITSYLDRETVSLIDVFHYLSLPYIVSNKFSFLYPPSFFIKKIETLIKKTIHINTAAGLFFILQK